MARFTNEWIGLREEKGVYVFDGWVSLARQAKLDPKWQDGAFIGIRDRSDEMLIMTIKLSVQNEECPETRGVGALGLRIPHDVEGYAVEPESGGARDGS